MNFVCFLLAGLVQISAAQNSPGAVQNTAQNPSVPTVTFDSVWESATPQEYIITVRSDGPSTYLSRSVARPVQADENREDKRWADKEKAAPSEAQDPDFHVEFTMSFATAQRIFKDAAQANYF